MTEMHANGQPQPFRVRSESESEIVFIPTCYDATIGKDIVLWDDIQIVFNNNAQQIRNGPYAILFVKGNNFRYLIPLRIQADQESVFEVIIKDVGKSIDQIAINDIQTIEESAAKTIPQDDFEQLNLTDGNDSFKNLMDATTSNSLLDNGIKGECIPYSTSTHATTEGTNDESEQMDHQNQQQVRVEENDIKQHYEAGLAHEEGNEVPQDYNKAFERYIMSAEQGYPKAQYKIGRFYFDGHGVIQDYSKAMEWYVRASDQGDAKAQRGIGYLYDHGHGVSQDNSKAMEWYLKAAEQGDVGAQYNIGVMYNNGYCVTQDYSKAIEWYLKAADQGGAGAQYSIGFMYKNGNGVTQDYSKAMEWFLKAAEQGYADAQCNIGLMYDNGYGVTQDYSKAME
ncbi:hypothetical protein BGZ76_000358, partial [Entomortierella beljakovae]